MYVPTHALAKEQAQKLREANSELTVKAIAGRGHVGADGNPLCRKHKVAEALAAAGGEVYTSLCAREKGKQVERCKHYDSCPYIQQFGPADVTLYTHAHLLLPRMRLEPKVPDVAIIDEAFFTSCIDQFKAPLSLLRGACGGPMTSRICAEIEHVLINGLR